MPSLALVCIHANVLMMICHPSPFRVSGRFISIKGTAGGSGDSTGGGTGGFGTFLFHTIGSGVLIAFGD